jgi:hypothetical protein
MINKIYETPKSKLTDDSTGYGRESIISFNGGYTLAMKQALGFSIFIQIALSATNFYDTENLDITAVVIALLLSLTHQFILVYFIAKLRGIKVKGESNTEVGNIGAWGYFWRTWVTYMFSLITVGSLIIAVNTSASPSIVSTIVYGLLMIPASIFYVWAFFRETENPS